MEIEIKAKFENKEKIKENLISLSAKKENEKNQIDEYYNHPSRDIRKTNEYIRLRYKNGENKGIFAYHINISDGVNKEFEVEIKNIDIYKQILNKLGFSILGVINKKRETYNLGDFKITIDEVKDIGNFIEVEVDGKESEVDEKKKQCLEIIEKIGIPKENICKNIWLCDIATGKTKWKV